MPRPDVILLSREALVSGGRLAEAPVGAIGDGAAASWDGERRSVACAITEALAFDPRWPGPADPTSTALAMPQFEAHAHRLPAPAAYAGATADDGADTSRARHAGATLSAAFALAILVIVASPQAAVAPSPEMVLAAQRLSPPAHASSAMAPWPIGLTAVVRSAAPELSPPNVATRVAYGDPQPALDRSPSATRPVRAPVRAPIPEQRLPTAQDVEDSLYSLFVDFLRETSARERPEGADWEASRE